MYFKGYVVLYWLFNTGNFCRFLLGQFSLSMKIKCLVIFFIGITTIARGQEIYSWKSITFQELHMLNVPEPDCNENISLCDNTFLTDSFHAISQMAIDPDTNVYGFESGTGNRIYKYDHSSNTLSMIWDNNVDNLNGLFTEDGNIFYSISFPAFGNILYKIDVANDEIVALGSVGHMIPWQVLPGPDCLIQIARHV